jgi:VCBS repeat-containing protein
MAVERSFAALIAAGVGALCATADSASGASFFSSHSFVEIVFKDVQEITTGTPAGRTGLGFVSQISGSGFTGGTSADGVKSADVNFGFIGGFPDGNAPLIGSGLFLGFNPMASASLQGDAFGIGTLFLNLALTDRTNAASSWLITAEIKSYVELAGTIGNIATDTGIGMASVAYDATDSLGSVSETTVNETRTSPLNLTRIDGPTRTISLQISGTPDADPAQALINLRVEAESRVEIIPTPGTVALAMIGLGAAARRRRN